MPDNSINLGNNVVKGQQVTAANKGVTFARPLSRFDGVRKLIVLEWTPLNEKGQFGDPVRIPFLINPEAIDWSQQHSYSQQQTRGGWTHTHWNDKPLTIRVRGNSGAYEYQKINLLRYAFKASGKSYLELKAYQERKGSDRDRFLSEHLGKQDAQTLQKLLDDTSYTNQNFLKGFLTNEALYQYVATVGKEAFKPVSTAISLSIQNKAVADINNNLYILKQNQKNQAVNNSANTNTSQTIKGSSNKVNLAPPTDEELLNGFTQLQQISNGRITAGISYIDPFAENVDASIGQNKSLYLSNIYTQTLANTSFAATPAGYLGSGVGQVNSNYNLLKNFLSTNQFGFLQSAATPLAIFAAKYLRLDNPAANSNNILTNALTSITSNRLYTNQLLGNISGLISSLSLEDDIRNKATELNSLIESYIENLNDLEDQMIVLQRQIIIQSKRLDTHLEAKKIKKIKEKISILSSLLIDILQSKGELESLAITPLFYPFGPSESDVQQARKIFSEPQTLEAIKQLQQIYQGSNAGSNPDAFIKKVNNLATNSQGMKNAIAAYKLAKNGAGDPFGSQLISQDSVQDFYSNVTNNATQFTLNKDNYLRGENLSALALKATPVAAAVSGQNILNNKPLADLSANKLESIKNLTNSQSNYSIFDSNLTIKPSLPDVVKLRFYYNGCIYEGFLANFDWHEQAGTSNITYEFEFIVEREFLGASLDNVPLSIKNNPGATKTYGNYRQGDFDPTLGNINYSNKPNYRLTTSATVLSTGDTVSETSIGDQRPNLYPDEGAVQNVALNPGINNTNNKVNSTVGNFGTTSDPNTLNNQTASELSKNMGI